MSENLFCSDQIIPSDEYKDNYNTIKWNKEKKYGSLYATYFWCIPCIKMYNKQELIENDKGYYCPVCKTLLMSKRFDGCVVK